MRHKSDKLDARLLPGSNFFERLLLLPLFGGIGRSDFWEIVERIPIGFHRLIEGGELVEAGARCDSLLFVTNGTVCASLSGESHQYKLLEWLASPVVVQPESLFGLTTVYSRSFYAAEDVQYFVISKGDVRDVLFEYPTFRINYLNMLSRLCQQQNRYLWRAQSLSLYERFVYYLQQRCIHPAGRKQLQIRMDDLADSLLATRLRVSQMLHDFQERELLTSLRGRIDIPKFEQLISAASEFH